jgi:hypothetical protein
MESSHGFESQDVGRAAEDAANAVWSSIGAVSEPLRIDIGEDALVRTRLCDRWDPSKIWVQVKGTSHLDNYRCEGGYSYPVNRASLVRWLSLSDLAVFVLVPVEKGGYPKYRPLPGLYVVLEDQFRNVDVQAMNTKTVQVKIGSEDEFNADAAHHLAWRAKLANTERELCTLIAGSESLASVVAGTHDLANQDPQNFTPMSWEHVDAMARKKDRILESLMADLGLLQNERISLDFLERFARALSGDEGLSVPNDERTFGLAVANAMFDHVSSRSSGNGIPTVTAPSMMSMLSGFIAVELVLAGE